MKRPDPVPGSSVLIFIVIIIIMSVLSWRANTGPYCACFGEQWATSERQVGELELNKNG